MCIMVLIFMFYHCIQNDGKDVGIIIWILSGCIFYFKRVAVKNILKRHNLTEPRGQPFPSR